MKGNYDKRPCTRVDGTIFQGWGPILDLLSRDGDPGGVLIVDYYTGVCEDELNRHLKTIRHTLFVESVALFKAEPEIREMTRDYITDDALFGYMSPLVIEDYFDEARLAEIRRRIAEEKGLVIIAGYGAAIVAEGDMIVYADMPRWEIQQRMRKGAVPGLGVQGQEEYIAIQYKRGLFNDWKVLDRHKQQLCDRVSYWLDTTVALNPKMIDQTTFLRGLSKVASGPFRLVPFFDPAPWGGQWMKEVCSLDPSGINYGWCFDCVPEENSLLLKINNTEFETPAINLVFFRSRALLGEGILQQFGKEFPIRFDFLDTMDGGNLSLQVHPTRQFALENFGIPYTQDESYYILDAKEDACVYLGVKDEVTPGQLLEALKTAEQEGFDADKYINRVVAKKHDHFLIPAGTVHCSGANAMVLEISATPFIYTFKLWDWDRLGLDGRPRPVNIARGKKVIDRERNGSFTRRELVNRFEELQAGDGWIEERTGLHETQFIETRRHTFTGTVVHQTNGTVNVLNLVEGAEVIVECLEQSFEPLIVHYAETFVIPAAVAQYTIRPHGMSAGKTCITIKAFVREAL